MINIKNTLITIKYEWYINHAALNELIIKGMTMRMDFTEKEFNQYRSDAMGWLSRTCDKVGDCELSNIFLVKTVDAINLDGGFAHLDNNANKDDLYSFRKIQLEGILHILKHFQLNHKLVWTNIRSWFAILISALALIVKFI